MFTFSKSIQARRAMLDVLLDLIGLDQEIHRKKVRAQLT